MEEALKLLYYVEEKYPPHDKWLLQDLKKAGKVLSEHLANGGEMDEIFNAFFDFIKLLAKNR